MAFIAYGRWQIVPLREKSRAAELEPAR